MNELNRKSYKKSSENVYPGPSVCLVTPHVVFSTLSYCLPTCNPRADPSLLLYFARFCLFREQLSHGSFYNQQVGLYNINSFVHVVLPKNKVVLCILQLWKLPGVSNLNIGKVPRTKNEHNKKHLLLLGCEEDWLQLVFLHEHTFLLFIQWSLKFDLFSLFEDEKPFGPLSPY